MRITLVTQYYPPEHGAVLYGWRLATGLVAHGHSVTVIAGLPHFPTGMPHPGFGRFFPQVRWEGGVRVIRTPLVMGSNRQSIRRVFGFVTFSASALTWMLLGRRPDVIIASVPPATTAISGFLASRFRRCPMIALLRDIEPWRALRHRGHAEHLAGRLLIRMFMWVYRRSERVVVMHNREILPMIEHGVCEDNIEVIPHGVAGVDLELNPGVLKIALPRKPGRKVLLYTGTIGLVHGLPAFLEAIAAEEIRGLPIDFVFMGDGQYKDECVRIANDRKLYTVTFMPSVSPHGVAGVLRQADMLVCTFRNHDDVPLCSKFYEYCNAGKPILVFGRNVACDVVSEIGNGLHCEAGNSGGLYAALTDFLSSPEKWSDRGERGRLYAQAHFLQSYRDDQWDKLMTSVSSPSNHERQQ